MASLPRKAKPAPISKKPPAKRFKRTVKKAPPNSDSYHNDLAAGGYMP